MLPPTSISPKSKTPKQQQFDPSKTQIPIQTILFFSKAKQVPFLPSGDTKSVQILHRPFVQSDPSMQIHLTPVLNLVLVPR